MTNGLRINEIPNPNPPFPCCNYLFTNWLIINTRISRFFWIMFLLPLYLTLFLSPSLSFSLSISIPPSLSLSLFFSPFTAHLWAFSSFHYKSTLFFLYNSTLFFLYNSLSTILIDKLNWVRKLAIIQSIFNKYWYFHKIKTENNL